MLTKAQHIHVLYVTAIAAIWAALWSVLAEDVVLTIRPGAGAPLVNLTVVFPVTVAILVLVAGYSRTPKPVAEFLVDGIRVGERFISWDEIRSASPMYLFGRMAVTLDSGEAWTFWVPQNRDARVFLGRERLAAFRDLRSLVRWLDILRKVGDALVIAGL